MSARSVYGSCRDRKRRRVLRWAIPSGLRIVHVATARARLHNGQRRRHPDRKPAHRLLARRTCTPSQAHRVDVAHRAAGLVRLRGLMPAGPSGCARHHHLRIMTVLALLHFAQQQVDWVVLGWAWAVVWMPQCRHPGRQRHHPHQLSTPRCWAAAGRSPREGRHHQAGRAGGDKRRRRPRRWPSSGDRRGPGAPGASAATGAGRAKYLSRNTIAGWLGRRPAEHQVNFGRY